jgi:transposase
MFGIDRHTKVYIARDALDFRKQIDGLSVYVQEVLALNPLSAHLFVFRNRRRDKIKILYWDHNGFCLLYKRLSRGRFPWPGENQAVMTCGRRELQWLLEGLDIRTLSERPTLAYAQI